MIFKTNLYFEIPNLSPNDSKVVMEIIEDEFQSFVLSKLDGKKEKLLDEVISNEIKLNKDLASKLKERGVTKLTILSKFTALKRLQKTVQ